MERLVFIVYGFWFWLTRKYRAARYGEAADSLRHARIYLLNDFATRASTRDRGYMLPHQVEALAVLERHSAFTARNSRRFTSLGGCCRFIVEELAEPQVQPALVQPAALVPEPSVSFFALIAGRVAAVAGAGLNSLPSFVSFWASESVGSIGDLGRARWRMSEAFANGADHLPRLTPHAAKQQIQ